MSGATYQIVRAGLLGLLLAGCNSGSSDSDSDSESENGSVSMVTLSGRAAVGAPIAGALVEARCADESGFTQSVDTDSGGRFEGRVARAALPCALRVNGGTAETRLHSYTEAAGNVNITPLTDLIIAVTTSISPAAWYDRSDRVQRAQGLAAAQEGFLDTLRSQGYDLPGGDFDPFRSPFTIGDAADQLLDQLMARVNTMANVDNYTAFVDLMSSGNLALIPQAPGTTGNDTETTDPLIPSPPQLAASSYILMDAETRDILVSHNADERLPPASLAKLMTSYIAGREIIEGRLDLADEALISDKAWRTGGLRMFLDVGTNVSIEDLLRGIIIQFGNDAAVALAEHIAGSEKLFVQMMNAHAERMGLTNTHFTNATGWPDANQYSSAADMAVLSRHIIDDNARFYPLYAERYFTYNDIRQPNRNRLLWLNPSVDGLKTGHTNEGGYAKVASAEQDGVRLITVVMGASSDQARLQETQKLLTYGFGHF